MSPHENEFCVHSSTRDIFIAKSRQEWYKEQNKFNLKFGPSVFRVGTIFNAWLLPVIQGPKQYIVDAVDIDKESNWIIFATEVNEINVINCNISSVVSIVDIGKGPPALYVARNSDMRYIKYIPTRYSEQIHHLRKIVGKENSNEVYISEDFKIYLYIETYKLNIPLDCKINIHRLFDTLVKSKIIIPTNKLTETFNQIYLVKHKQLKRFLKQNYLHFLYKSDRFYRK